MEEGGLVSKDGPVDAGSRALANELKDPVTDTAERRPGPLYG